MSKSISNTLKAALAAEVSTIATCWRITREDGTEFFFTDHDIDLIIDDDTYEAASGMTSTQISQKRDMSVDNLECLAFLESDKIREADIIAGLFDFATVDIFLVNYEDYESAQVT